MVIAGCAGNPPAPVVPPAAPVAPFDTLAALTDSAAAADTMALVLPEEPDVVLPVGPDGRAELADLEALYRDILDLLARGESSRAEDVLLTLQDQVLLPSPAGADTAWQAHRLSLERRLYLLAALMTESRAFAGAPAAADSLLAAGYHALERYALPDSLFPATGTELPPLVADLMEVDNKAVRRWIDYYTGRGRHHFSIWLERKAAAESLVCSVLEEEGLPRELIYLALIESGLSPRAHSSVGAVGPWQFMPGTARRYGLRRSWWVDERRDLELSTRAAAAYLSDLYDRFGNWALVLAAYNTGENRVARQIRLTGHDNYWRLRLPRQTSDFVPKFIAAARIGEDPTAYGFDLLHVTPLRYDVVTTDDATDLALIAECAGAGEHELLALNPALLRGASPPDAKDYPVRVPYGARARTVTELAHVPADRRLTWRSHRVLRGETLSQIARRYGTSVGDLVRLNSIADPHLIRPGNQLLIPMPASLAEKARSRAAEKGHYVPPDGYERISYKVRQGDTLGGIARKLGVTLQHLRKVNGIYKTSLIHPGQRIYAYRPGGTG
jgi:membrane-bound lytic murein transglycosylase D